MGDTAVLALAVTRGAVDEVMALAVDFVGVALGGGVPVPQPMPTSVSAPAVATAASTRAGVLVIQLSVVGAPGPLMRVGVVAGSPERDRR